MKSNTSLNQFLFKPGQYLLWVFLAFSGLNLFAEAFNWRAGILFSKPTLMIWLLLFYIISTKKTANRKLRNTIIVAIIFAWAGDVFLLFAGSGEHFFLLGLGSFLITHLAYSKAFYHLTDKEKGRWPKLLIAGLLLFWILFNTTLSPFMSAELRPPVLVYSFVIMLMVLMAKRLQQSQPSVFANWIWWGAVLFLLSDTVIGLDKFGQELMQIPYARVLIMATYLSGQLLMVCGIFRTVLSVSSVRLECEF